MKQSKIARIVAAALAACLLAFTLSACSSDSDEKSQEASQNRQYLSLLGSYVADLQTVMADFEIAASEQNVVAMEAQMGKAEDVLGKIKDQEATPALKDIKDQYVSALDSLDQAMGSYVDLYEKALDGELSNGEAKSQIEQIQAAYDDAVAQLEEADKALKKLAE